MLQEFFSSSPQFVLITLLFCNDDRDIPEKPSVFGETPELKKVDPTSNGLIDAQVHSKGPEVYIPHVQCFILSDYYNIS